MDAFILAGGLGSRLRPYTTVLPKPLMPLGEEPILDIILRQLVKNGFGSITLSTGYLATLIEAFIEAKAYENIEIEFVKEESPLGTAGPLRLLENVASPFVMLNGDILADFDFRLFLETHKKSGNIITVGVFERVDAIPLGVLDLNADGTISKYREKPKIKNFVSMGVYALSPEIMNYVPSIARFDMPELITSLIGAGEKVGSYLHNGFWLDIGNHEDYARAQDNVEKHLEDIFG